jgi:hypothetical protein
MTGHRSLSTIAREIRDDWRPVYYAAAPYLSAMSGLYAVTDSYDYDSGRSVVNYFLSNAGTWRGPVARRIKAELKDMLK